MTIRWCSDCGTGLAGADGLCWECRDVDASDDEVTHKDKVRCPFCRGVQSVSGGLYEIGLYDEGDHDVSCDECGKDFRVVTMVTHSFRSPAIGEDEVL